MLSPKPWRAEAIVRLVVSVFVCMITGSLVTNLLHACAHGAKPGWKLWVLTGVSAAFLVATLWQLRHEWQPENLLRGTVLPVCCFYVGFVLAAVAQHLTGPLPTKPSPVQMLIGVLSFQGAGLLLAWHFTREHHLDWREAFGLEHRWGFALLLGLLLACLYLPIAQALQWLSLTALDHLPKLAIKPEEQQAVQALRSAGGWGERVVLGTITIGVAPIMEEVLFRGVLYPWGKQAGFPRLALWGTALIFAVVHANLAILLPLFVLAVALTLLYEATDNLLAPIAAHSLFNGLNFLKLYLPEGSAFLFLLLVLMMILVLVLLLLASSTRHDEVNG